MATPICPAEKICIPTWVYNVPSWIIVLMISGGGIMLLMIIVLAVQGSNIKNEMRLTDILRKTCGEDAFRAALTQMRN
jgi:hypothetical protein